MVHQVLQKRERHYFNEEWETEFLFTNVEGKSVCLICEASIAVSIAARHFTTIHDTFISSYLPGTSLREAKVNELKATLSRQQ